MAIFEEHCKDCERLIGDRCEEVNLWMDLAFRVYGPRHRFDRHHWAGVDKAEELFGAIGRKAAIVHILKDCGHIPRVNQWQNQEVDTLGMLVDSNFNGHWDPAHFDKIARAHLELNETRADIKKLKDL